MHVATSEEVEVKKKVGGTKYFQNEKGKTILLFLIEFLNINIQFIPPSVSIK
ncbi:hypothetical protein NGI46_14830 [Peribacillus butanolivorans]|uniref:hypothetical protein n=1 Tax=Peribacillus butanolivorans TaxID=421767 RepID=UPI00207CC9A4|nr:hypothetical protein [Peribacillus butanolivorans]MCO0598706.1 hypothetical protein [Peribacillus butanolivorans]